ncbi:GAP family protein [Geodermatophilus sp. YIM 151500]|uniref:GAP family protein n=1 Tax=Geodermatophilus sp. YIM 151500 TaxID=2984531 RepID=UPI0021E43352|nr:GAP family protein [Geodermatophilus sp. YIM 151500]MCV2488805.1 GAP family protein [Geodermatophilus sp. YIM 151500]
MTPALAAGIAGLAAVDSFNPATIAGVALILLSPMRRPVASALAFVLGCYAVVLALGTVVFLSAGAAAEAVSGGLVWIRRVAFAFTALALLVVAVRRLRERRRGAVELPAWFSPWTAAPIGVLVTGADLPNAFPLFIAIERLIAADVPTGAGVRVLALYDVVYCLPCLVLLVLGTLHRDRVRRRLARVYDRIGRERTVPRSVPAAAGLTLLAIGAGVVAATA